MLTLRTSMILLVPLASAALVGEACAPGLLAGTDRVDSGAQDVEAGPTADASADSPSPQSDAAAADATGDALADSSSQSDAADSGPCDGGTCTIVFSSSPAWESYDADGGDLGPAMAVCLAPDAPSTCPINVALVYTQSSPGWAANLTAIPDAEWIWRADVTLDASANLAIATFHRTFELGANPSGSIWIGADNFAEVQINGQPVPPFAIGSVTDAAASIVAANALTQFVLTPYLVSGPNTLVIFGQNGGESLQECGAGWCTYQENPAGVVFGGSFSYE